MLFAVFRMLCIYTGSESNHCDNTLNVTGLLEKISVKAISIQRLPNTMNLDCNMILSNTWTLALKLYCQQQYLISHINFSVMDMHAHACNHH